MSENDLAIADLQIHSHFSRATSIHMNLENIAFYAAIKGLTIVGTGDITHPAWFAEVSSKLETDDASGLYMLKEKPKVSIRFMITAEVSTIYDDSGTSRKVHHCMLMPSLEVAAQIADVLENAGDLRADGRPIVKVSSPELVERVMGVSRELEIFPAHAWTPWWSVFGANSGFDSLKECYRDQLKHVHAVETGLSSDPPMNWRLSDLDDFTLLSNSDCHSPYPHRLGREANVFSLEHVSYDAIIDAIRMKDSSRLLYTIETKPEYGKYHWTGHRSCGVLMPSKESLEIGNKCPKCGRTLTRGVEQRVDQLADRPDGFKPEGVPAFRHLLPLHELIAAVRGEVNPLSKGVQGVYSSLTNAFGNEFRVMLDIPYKNLVDVVGPEMANAIIAVREDRVEVLPGYDGVYGKIDLTGKLTAQSRKAEGNLNDWIE